MSENQSGSGDDWSRLLFAQQKIYQQQQEAERASQQQQNQKQPAGQKDPGSDSRNMASKSPGSQKAASKGVHNQKIPTADPESERMGAGSQKKLSSIPVMATPGLNKQETSLKCLSGRKIVEEKISRNGASVQNSGGEGQEVANEAGIGSQVATNGRHLTRDNPTVTGQLVKGDQQKTMRGQQNLPIGGKSLREECSGLVTQLRDEVLQILGPELKAQEVASERVVVRTQILMRDAVDYKNKLEAVKSQYTARLQQVSSALGKK